mmetsp:Transcript_25958/g.60021  ORF Transcript_25958/g.60021 Transcript_25958/m.60021 type:complete len:168 (+) Transcript_25958:90-593(+)
MAAGVGRGPDWQRKKSALSAGELLLLLSPPAFDMRQRIPKGATIAKSPPERWWRSDSPLGHPDDAPDSFVKTRGASGSCQYHTQYQVGAGTAAHFKQTTHPKTVSGYSGHIAGKYSGSVMGGTYNKALADAEEYLKTQSQLSTPRSTLYSPRNTRFSSPRTPRAGTR